MPVRRAQEFSATLPLKNTSTVFCGNPPCPAEPVSITGAGKAIGWIFASRSCQRGCRRMRRVGSIGCSE